MGPNDRRAFILIIYTFIAVYLIPIFPHGGSANELTRWATAASIVERGSFEISWTEPLIGPNVDTAKVGTSLYSNKAPGTALVAVPFYALLRPFIGPPDASNIRVSWYVMRIVTATLPLLILGIWLYFREVDEIGLATLLFATPLFIYSLLFFSHLFAAILVYLAFRLLYDARYLQPLRCILAGLAAGFAVISEFPAVFPIAILGAGLLFTDKTERKMRIFYFLLGGMPFLVFLLIYNNALFGSPLAFSYGYESFPEWAEVAGQGVFGIGVPTLSNIYLLLFSPSRGLFFFAPLLLLAMTALWRSPEKKTVRHRVKFAAIIITALILCGHGAAHGGWAAGPRYLVLILPLMLDSMFDGELYDSSNIWQGFLFAVSFLMCTLPLLTFPFAPPEFRFPHNDFWFAFVLSEGWFTPNLGNVVGIPHGILSILPVLAALMAVAAIVILGMRRPKRFTIGASLGLALFAIYLAVPNLEDAEGLRLRRASIAERYFIPTGRVYEARIAAEEKMDHTAIANLSRNQWLIADARAYAPNDFPYLDPTQLGKSPTAMVRKAAEAQAAGRSAEAEQILTAASAEFPFAACDMRTNLAVIYYTTGRKEPALTELEAIRPAVGPASRPDCLRSIFLLGSLYRELGREQQAVKAFTDFNSLTANSKDPQINALRRQLELK